jgi:hypothetical protein
MSSGHRFFHRLLVNGTIILVSVVATLVLLEGALRLWDGIPLFSTDNFVARALDAQHSIVSVYEPRLGWISRPNFTKLGFRLTTGEYGLRMTSDRIVPPQQGQILVVGDSFGAGAEVLNGESWPAQLERRIGMPVLNGAVGGYAFDQIVLRAEELQPILKPSMVLVQTRLEYGISVDRMSIVSGTPKPYFMVENSKLVLKNEPVPRLASRSRDIGWVRSVFGYSYLVQFVMTRLNELQWWVAPSMAIKFEMTESEADDVTCLLMHRLAQFRDQTGVKMALVVQYSALDGLTDKLSWQADHDRVMSCAQRENLDIIDTLEATRDVYRKGGLAAYQKLWVMHDNKRVYGHMSPEGNRLVANLIYDHLFAEKAASRDTALPVTAQKSK